GRSRLPPGRSPLQVLGHHLVEEADQDVLLVAEVEVDRAVGHPGPAGDVGDPGGEVAPAGEHLHRRVQDAGALVVAAPTRHVMNEPPFSMGAGRLPCQPRPPPAGRGMVIWPFPWLSLPESSSASARTSATASGTSSGPGRAWRRAASA